MVTLKILICNFLSTEKRRSLKLALDFSGGIIAYSSPVPDLLGASNITSEQILWEEQSHGLLTDGNYGLQDINVNKILTYGEYVMVHVSALENILILWKKALFYVKEYGTHFQ